MKHVWCEAYRPTTRTSPKAPGAVRPLVLLVYKNMVFHATSKDHDVNDLTLAIFSFDNVAYNFYIIRERKNKPVCVLCLATCLSYTRIMKVGKEIKKCGVVTWILN